MRVRGCEGDTGPKVTFPATRFVSEMLLRFDMTLVCHVV